MKYFVLIFVFVVAHFVAPAQTFRINDDLQLVYLQDSVYMHISWHDDEAFGRFPSNGLVIVRSGRALIVDTPFDNEKTEILVTALKDLFSAVVTIIIPGHFHDDCMGGLEYLHNIGVKSLANSLTVSKCRELKLPIPSESFTGMKTFNFYGEEVECRYIGPGHSFDNIVVWLPDSKILFGGCLIKSAGSVSLGNLSDADVNNWDGTVRKLSGYYKDINIVVPGHGEAGGPDLLEHTIRLVEEHKVREMK